MIEPKTGWYKLIDREEYVGNYNQNSKLIDGYFHIRGSDAFIMVDEVMHYNNTYGGYHHEGLVIGNEEWDYHHEGLVIGNEEWDYFEYIGEELPNNNSNITNDDTKDLQSFPDKLKTQIKRSIKIDLNDKNSGFRGEPLKNMDEDTLNMLNFSNIVFKSQQKIIDEFKDNTSNLLESLGNLKGLLND